MTWLLTVLLLDVPCLVVLWWVRRERRRHAATRARIRQYSHLAAKR